MEKVIAFILIILFSTGAFSRAIFDDSLEALGRFGFVMRGLILLWIANQITRFM